MDRGCSFCPWAHVDDLDADTGGLECCDRLLERGSTGIIQPPHARKVKDKEDLEEDFNNQDFNQEDKGKEDLEDMEEDFNNQDFNQEEEEEEVLLVHLHLKVWLE